jgi:hypothetical protein
MSRKGGEEKRRKNTGKIKIKRERNKEKVEKGEDKMEGGQEKERKWQKEGVDAERGTDRER